MVHRTASSVSSPPLPIRGQWYTAPHQGKAVHHSPPAGANSSSHHQGPAIHYPPSGVSSSLLLPPRTSDPPLPIKDQQFTPPPTIRGQQFTAPQQGPAVPHSPNRDQRLTIPQQGVRSSESWARRSTLPNRGQQEPEGTTLPHQGAVSSTPHQRDQQFTAPPVRDQWSSTHNHGSAVQHPPSETNGPPLSPTPAGAGGHSFSSPHPHLPARL